MVAPDELCPFGYTHRVFSDKVQRLFVTLSYFWPDRFVQLLNLIPILVLLLYLLVSIDLVYTGFGVLVLGVLPRRRTTCLILQLSNSKIFSNCSGAETTLKLQVVSALTIKCNVTDAISLVNSNIL